MTNATSLKYHNLYTVNRLKNDLFDRWIEENYSVKVSHEMWSYGEETFIDRKTGERTVSDSKIMQKYVKGKNPYFRDFAQFDEWLDSDYATQEEFFRA